MAAVRTTRLRLIQEHAARLAGCRACPDMIGPVVTGQPVLSPVMLIGQAPGTHEGPLGRPFAWTAGKTMFGWFASIGVTEDEFRSRVYMAAVARCFPGKDPKGGDRVPSPVEIARCGSNLAAEIEIVRPSLILAVGKLAIGQILPEAKQLAEVVGSVHRVRYHGHEADVVPLPHPSGASTWHRTEPGKTLLAQALGVIAAHPAWSEIRTAKAKRAS